MRALSAAQEALAASPDQDAITLVRVTFWSDYDGGTVEATRHYSSVTCVYPFDGVSDVSFDGYLIGLDSQGDYGDGQRSMPPRPAGDSVGGTERVRLQLMNEVIVPGQPERVWDDWRSMTNIRRARVEVAELLVSPARMRSRTSATGRVWWDLRDLPGGPANHQWEFVGEILTARQSSPAVIQVVCGRQIPDVDWPEATSINTPPEYLGTRLPIPIGRANRVPAIPVVLQWRTTITEKIGRKQEGGTITLTDSSGVPAGRTFSVIVSDEEMEVQSGTDPSILTISDRARNGTKRGRHPAGSVIYPKADVVFAVSGVPIEEARAFYLRSPFADDLVSISGFEQSIRDAGVELGKTIGSARFTPDEWVGVIRRLSASTDTVQQPEFRETGDSPNTNETADADGSVVEYFVPSAQVEWTGLPPGSDPKIERVAQGSNPSGNFGMVFNIAGGTPASSEDVVRFRFKLTCVMAGITGGNTVRIGGDLYSEALGVPRGSDGRARAVRDSNGSASDTGEWIEAEGKSAAEIFSSTVNIRRTILGGSGTNVGNTVEFTSVQVEIEQVGASTTIVREVDVEVEGAYVGAGIEAYADVDGAVVPYAFSELYRIDDDSSWVPDSAGSGSASTLTGEAPDGGDAVRLEIGEIVNAMDDTSDWSGPGTISNTLPAAPGTYTYNTGSIGFGETPAPLVESRWVTTANLPMDMSGGQWLTVDIQVDGDLLSQQDGIRVRLQSSSGHWREQWFGKDDGLGQGGLGTAGQGTLFTTLWIDLESTDWDDEAGSIDWTSVSQIELAKQIIGVGFHGFSADAIKLIPKRMILRDLGSIVPNDYTALDGVYRLGYRIPSFSPSENETEAIRACNRIEVWFSTVAGTRPAAYRQMSILQSELADSTAGWVAAENSTLDVGSPSLTTIFQVNIEVIFDDKPSSSLGAGQLPTIDFWIFEAAEANPDYIADTGELIERAEDVVRFFATEIAGWTGGLDLSQGSRISSHDYAGNLTMLGTGFLGVLAKLGFHFRSSFVIRDVLGVPTLTMIAAESDLGYPEPVSALQIGRTNSVLEQIADGNDVHTRFVAYYDLDPSSLFGGENGYRGRIVANPILSQASGVTTAELQAAEDAVGVRHAEPFFFPLIADETTASLVFGGIVKERLGQRSEFSIQADGNEVYRAELGDVVRFDGMDSVSRKGLVFVRNRRQSGAAHTLSVLEVE